jgi:hypothetical protein
MNKTYRLIWNEPANARNAITPAPTFPSFFRSQNTLRSVLPWRER